MCWDIALHSENGRMARDFPGLRDNRNYQQIDFDFDFFENVQAVNFPEYPIIFKDEDSGALVLQAMQWGILPTYIQDSKEQEARRRNQINIRCERILGDNQSTWYRLRHQRCLIPVSGFYEHRQVLGFKKKVPYYIGIEGRPLFYLPGLYQWHEWVDSEAEVRVSGTFGLITREANELMGWIHNEGANRGRMPLMLSAELERRWLEDIDGEGMAEIFGYCVPSSDLVAYAVYTLRGAPTRPDGGRRFDPYSWPGLPELGSDDVQGKIF